MSTMLAKPVRAIMELNPTEQFIRAVDRARELRDQSRARADADYVERIEDARMRFLAPTEDLVAPAGTEATPSV